eukprot:TRINITY_DN2997_c0_g1_i2.p1 TRINITY_DN2997_c0_g1~~TRINITY_DN2997_c0_g1_i2.p1  ORF type:complete len:159 (+),score=30.89 TRINITY_DN2997_c0_g1_i2:65-541(+)
MRKENCVFSGLPVHPGHGKKYVPTLVQSTRPVLVFFNQKTRKMYLRKKNPRDIRWTMTYRRINKKMVSIETIRKRATKVKKVQRPIVGADIETINKRRDPKWKIEVRAAAREAALKELQARKAKSQAEAKKVPIKAQQKATKAAQKVPVAKAPKKTGR